MNGRRGSHSLLDPAYRELGVTWRTRLLLLRGLHLGELQSAPVEASLHAEREVARDLRSETAMRLLQCRDGSRKSWPPSQRASQSPRPSTPPREAPITKLGTVPKPSTCEYRRERERAARGSESALSLNAATIAVDVDRAYSIGNRSAGDRGDTTRGTFSTGEDRCRERGDVVRPLSTTKRAPLSARNSARSVPFIG